VAARFQEAYRFLNIDLTPGFQQVVREIEEMELHILPDFAPGVHGALAELAREYKLGLVSDAIHTPGAGIRKLLEREGLLQYFSHWVFSDEVGRSKPAPIVFEQASSGLGVPLSQMAHVGDRESNDIAGPLALGMQAILYTGAIDRDSAHTRATAICRDYAELPAILKRIQEIGD
jgi:putative hydrolase of the HAD superfamily